MSSNCDKNTDMDGGDSSNNSNNKTVIATAYVPKPQYEKWANEAEKRDQSISQLISSMVEVGLNDIQVEKESPSDIKELRTQLRQVRAERDKIQKNLQIQEKQNHAVGMGKIKELIIDNPGIDRREIVNFVVGNPVVFVDGYLDKLELSNFVNIDGEWYPPDEVGDIK